MLSAFQNFGHLGAPAGAPWTESALYPAGASSPGLWIDGPSYPSSCYQDSAGTTALSTVGTVLDSSNPVGLVLDRKGRATSKTDPGIHLSQSTSAARPVASARVNLLTYTEDFSNAVWTVSVRNGTGGIPVKTPNYGAAPDGTNTACRLQISLGSGTGANDYSMLRYSTSAAMRGGCWVKSNTGATQSVMAFAYANSSLITVTTEWQRLENSCSAIGFDIGARGDIANDRNIDILIWHPQINTGTALLPYQRVGAASDYTATGFPAYLKFDGTDDGLASATFSAGTLTSSMDCLIAVRRDSTSNTVVGLYNTVADATKFFGMAESGSSSGCVGSGAGTPTVWVDGTQLTGGTAVTRGTLHTALTAGAWHIVEFRGLDLSTWTAVGHGLYTSYVRNGALGKIELFASGQDANRTKARARMAAYFGVTLP